MWKSGSAARAAGSARAAARGRAAATESAVPEASRSRRVSCGSWAMAVPRLYASRAWRAIGRDGGRSSARLAGLALPARRLAQPFERGLEHAVGGLGEGL